MTKINVYKDVIKAIKNANKTENDVLYWGHIDGKDVITFDEFKDRFDKLMDYPLIRRKSIVFKDGSRLFLNTIQGDITYPLGQEWEHIKPVCMKPEFKTIRTSKMSIKDYDRILEAINDCGKTKDDVR